VQIGFKARKVFSSTRVTKTVVVTPFFGNVATVVPPTARSETVRFLPATVSAFASDGAVATVGVGVAEAEGEADAVADGEGVAFAEGVADAVGEGVALALGEADGLGVDFATGFGGAFFTGAFFTGFLTTFFTGGFLAARARSPKKVAAMAPPIIPRMVRRPAG
jgi:hypothetical protein